MRAEHRLEGLMAVINAEIQIKSLENKPLNPGFLSPNELGEEPNFSIAPHKFGWDV